MPTWRLLGLPLQPVVGHRQLRRLLLSILIWIAEYVLLHITVEMLVLIDANG